MFLDFALTIPAVTVEVRLKGLPTASTQSPNFRSSELPNSVKRRSFSSTFNNAKSVFGSVPIILADNSLPSFNVIKTLEASSITWLFVTM